jgi:penicillin-binding protein 2
LTEAEVARFAAQRFRFPGAEIKARLFRNYPYGELASHVIGYIGRINQAEKEAIEQADDQSNYRARNTLASWAWSKATTTISTALLECNTWRLPLADVRCGVCPATPATPGDTGGAFAGHQAAALGGTDVWPEARCVCRAGPA